MTRLLSKMLNPNSITLAGSKLVADRFEAKFHYVSWFEAGSKLVADRFEADRRPVSNLSATSFEPASVMEFGFKQVKQHSIGFSKRVAGIK